EKADLTPAQAEKLFLDLTQNRNFTPAMIPAYEAMAAKSALSPEMKDAFRKFLRGALTQEKDAAAWRIPVMLAKLGFVNEAWDTLSLGWSSRSNAADAASNRFGCAADLIA